MAAIFEGQGKDITKRDKSYNMIVAGMTGSGKSTLINDFIRRIQRRPDTQMVLIDPKGFELVEYQRCANTLWYADDEEDIYDTLCNVYDLMMMRKQRIKDQVLQTGRKASNEPHVYVFVDEMTLLMNSDYRKDYIRMFGRIAVIGRSMRIHLVLCTQTATRDTIPNSIRDNMPIIICLRQEDDYKYRYLMGRSFPDLPAVGMAYVKWPDSKKPVKMETDKIWDTLELV